MNKFIVSYELAYIHRVSVGITAKDQAEAQQLAEQAFNDALIWDDSDTLPLLSDDYFESGDERIAWECAAVEHYPEPDHSVRQLKKQQAAFRACRGLIEAYQRGETVDWDQLLPLALEALDKPSLEN